MTSVPSRFDITAPDYRAKAQGALKRDGAVILTNVLPDETRTTSSSKNNNNSFWQERAAGVPGLLFDHSQLLLGEHQAAGVHVEHDGLELQGMPLPPHSDGYVWGDAYPDLVILLCEQAAEGSGGESYLIDGEMVVQKLDQGTKKLLQDVSVDHTERTEEGALVTGAESFVPVIRWQDLTQPSLWQSSIESGGGGDSSRLDNQRLVWRRQVHHDYVFQRKDPEGAYISLWGGTTDNDKAESVKEALLEVDTTIAEVDKESARFQLQKGEALIVDNFRMLHARGAYRYPKQSTMEGTGDAQARCMWRVWSWTNASFGLPPSMKTGRGSVAATVQEAGKVLAAAQ